MNTASNPANNTLPANLPLSVVLFESAMSRDVALSDFAEQLDIGTISLRQFISGKTRRPRGKTLESMAEMLEMPIEEVRHRATLLPTAAPLFSEWLQKHMKGRFSRAKLTNETRISDGALRNYLSGQTLPDTDQARRLAEAFDVPFIELAMVIVADQTLRSGGETIPPEPPMSASKPKEAERYKVAEHAVDAEKSVDATNVHDVRLASEYAEPATLNPEYTSEEIHLVNLWRQLHPQGRRATLKYIAELLVEG